MVRCTVAEELRERVREVVLERKKERGIYLLFFENKKIRKSYDIWGIFYVLLGSATFVG